MRCAIGILLLLLIACGSGFKKRQLMLETQAASFYSLPADVYPDRDLQRELPAMAEPGALERETIENVLGALKYRRSTFLGRIEGSVFSPAELGGIARSMHEALSNLPAGHRLVFIVRYDPDNSILSKMLRTTGVFWKDEEGYNLVLGEINDELPGSSFFDDDWKEVMPVSFKRNLPDLEIEQTEQFTHKKIRGYMHRTWIVIPEEEIAEIRYEKKDSGPSGPSPYQRLHELRKALKDGLITEEEYKEKRKELLQNM
ncbi:MAG: hypothetical protein HS115_12990 [Spirochaetales bacterium]|nr:hypothetical protein [Spirochaetales bacterium]